MDESRADSEPLQELPATARRILQAAQTILSERGYADLTITAIERESGANRALVSYYFGSKAGLVDALVESLFKNPDVGLVEEIRNKTQGVERTTRFLDWQERVSANDRVNRMLYELLPHALRDPSVRARFADEYRMYREVDAACISPDGSEPGKTQLSPEEAEALAAVSIAVVEGLGMQRALDPESFDHERAWRAWRKVLACYLQLPEASSDQ